MKYYRRWLGDYLKKTIRLSMIEHGAYGLLLDYYYAEERPIPAHLDEVYVICRATRPADRRAVLKVLEAYFQRREDGWHNARADQELGTAARARENGKGGGRPKTQTGTQNTTQKQTQTETQDPTQTGHPPTSNLQPKEKSNPMSGSPPDVPPPEKRKPNGNGALHGQAEQVLEYLNRTTGRDFRFRNPNGKLTPNADVIVARLGEGYTAEQLREVVHLKAEKWRGDEKMAEYLRPATLFGKQKFAQYVGELGA